MSKKKKEIDIKLINKILEGDINKFSEIVELYQDKLLKYILLKTNIWYQDAEALLQDIFIKVYKNLNAYNSKYSFNSWIYKITHNYVIDNFKKTQKQKDNTVSLDEFLDNDDNKNSLLEILIDENVDLPRDLNKKELQLKVIESLNKLDTKYKEALILRYFEWLKYEEIWEILKIPYNTVWTLVQRWLKNLKKIAIQDNLQRYIDED